MCVCVCVAVHVCFCGSRGYVTQVILSKEYMSGCHALVISRSCKQGKEVLIFLVVDVKH